MSAFGVAARAFEEALCELRLPGAAQTSATAQAELGRRAALLAVADTLWQRHLGLMLEGAQVQKLLKIGTRQGVNDLVRRHRMLALPGPRGRALYPAFQFTKRGRPHPALPAVLGHFEAAGVKAHTIASWFTTPQAYLANQTPAARLAEAPEGLPVIESARRSAARLGQ